MANPSPGVATPSAIESIHERHVRGRRVRRLRGLIAPMLEGASSVLDIGSGDGRLAASLARDRPGLTIAGVDVLVRPDAAIPTVAFDGARLPFADRSFDVAMLVDVLHHTLDPLVLLREAARVARSHVVLKDHLREGLLARQRLTFMDGVGNRRHGVALPCNYLNRRQWQSAFDAANLRVVEEQNRLGLYPLPFSLCFDARLQVLFRLSVA